MSEIKTSQTGMRLYELLPLVYRTRDNSDHSLREKLENPDRYNGDLGLYLDACGQLLDLVQQTLEQRLADIFPDNPLDPNSLVCQDWLLPYFAGLLDVRLVSPHARGRREEITRAVGWRQRKGTIRVAEQLAQQVGQIEVEVQEGWKRVAVTPRIGKPFLQAQTYGYSSKLDESIYDSFPSIKARHPGLPAVTLDFRCPSGSVKLKPGESNPIARTTRFGEEKVPWRPVSFHGMPCHPGSYEDVSRRTVDMRSPTWRIGHYHPKRMLMYYPPPPGFFIAKEKNITWDELHNDAVMENGVVVLRNQTIEEENPTRIVLQGDDVEMGLSGEFNYRLEGFHIAGELKITQGRLALVRCAVETLIIERVETETPVLEARDSVFDSLIAEFSLVRLEYCTVLTLTQIERLQASDSILGGTLDLRHEVKDDRDWSCIRYSRVPKNTEFKKANPFRHTTDTVHYFEQSFGQRGCGVLHPATPESVRFGAEDGGEMGAYHHLFYSLQTEAMQDKLKDYLPVGMDAVLIPDRRLLVPPKEIEN